MTETAYPAWGKTERFGAQWMIVTEKIDGTNALISIDVDGPGLRAGSRSRWLNPLAPKEDNYGFAAWCEANKEELLKLGKGRHYGEWWGCGIGKRAYSHTSRFLSLFNTRRPAESLPPCVLQVPVLYQGAYDPEAPHRCMNELLGTGSRVVPGHTNPEGVIVWIGRERYKMTFDPGPKGADRP